MEGLEWAGSGRWQVLLCCGMYCGIAGMTYLHRDCRLSGRTRSGVLKNASKSGMVSQNRRYGAVPTGDAMRKLARVTPNQSSRKTAAFGWP